MESLNSRSVDDQVHSSLLNNRYFKLVKSETGRKGVMKLTARCLLCPTVKLITADTQSESNFRTHLKRMHPETYKIYEQERFKGGKRRRRWAKRPKLPTGDASTQKEELKQREDYNRSAGEMLDFVNETSDLSDDDDIGMAHHNFRWYLRSDRVLHQLKSFFLGQEGVPTDVTLFSSEGKGVEAHRLILALCSPYFQNIFTKVSQQGSSNRPLDRSNPTVIVLGNVPAAMLEHLVQFMYTGEVGVTEDEKEEFERLCRLFQMDGVSPCTAASTNPQVIQVTVVGKKNSKRRVTAKKTPSEGYHQEVSYAEANVPTIPEVDQVSRVCKIEPLDEDSNFESYNVDSENNDYSPPVVEGDYDDDSDDDPDYGNRNSHTRRKRTSKSGIARHNPGSPSREKHSGVGKRRTPTEAKDGTLPETIDFSSVKLPPPCDQFETDTSLQSSSLISIKGQQQTPNSAVPSSSDWNLSSSYDMGQL